MEAWRAAVRFRAVMRDGRELDVKDSPVIGVASMSVLGGCDA